jgi:hypothetical protein
MANTITNDDDIIDSRDIIDRIEELSSYDLSDLSDDDIEELRTLKALAEQGEQESSDWTHGETLIHRRYFVDYVADMLADCGTIPKDIPWFVEIDWEATAGNIEADYASVDFDGQEYLIRSC